MGTLGRIVILTLMIVSHHRAKMGVNIYVCCLFHYNWNQDNYNNLTRFLRITYAKLKLYTPFSSDCVDHLNNYTCRCNDGFTGGNCEFEINECQSSPCVNGKFVYDVIVVVLAGVGVAVCCFCCWCCYYKTTPAWITYYEIISCLLWYYLRGLFGRN